MADSKSTDSTTLMSLCNDSNQYLQTIAQFDKCVAGWLADYKIWVNNYLGVRVLDKLSVKVPKGEQLRILGVGSGEGNVS